MKRKKLMILFSYRYKDGKPKSSVCSMAIDNDLKVDDSYLLKVENVLQNRLKCDIVVIDTFWIEKL